jgi:hypothetical protein
MINNGELRIRKEKEVAYFNVILSRRNFSERTAEDHDKSY